MNNKTMYEVKIKLRGDGVYDLYLDGKWMASKGSYESIANEFCEIMKNVEKLEV